LAQVEVDEMLGLVGDIRTEIPANDAVPGGVVLLVEFLLDVSGDIFLDAVLAERSSGDVNSILLHLVRHVGVLHNGAAHFTHGGKLQK